MSACDNLLLYLDEFVSEPDDLVVQGGQSFFVRLAIIQSIHEGDSCIEEDPQQVSGNL